MANPLKILWYINPRDGAYPWNPDGGHVEYDPQRIRDIAIAADKAGFYGALTVGKNPFIEIGSFIPVTQNLRYLIPVYPGQYNPAALVSLAQSFDELSGGRLLFNQVNGTDFILPQFGIDVPSDERYKLSAEYWTVFKKLYAGEIGGYEGKYFRFGPPPPPRGWLEDRKVLVQDPHTPVWGSDASPAGIEHAGQVLDTYLTYLHRPDRLGAQIDAARKVAAEHGRSLPAGTLANIIVRETEEEAWDYALQLLEKTGVQNIIRQIENRLSLGRYNVALSSRKIPTFNDLNSEDPIIQRRLDALRSGKLPDVRDLESHPNIWSGPNGWGALDILDQGWGGYFVGSAENVAARIKELQANQGIDAFILAGWPLLTEAQRVADLLFPLLDLDQSRPVLGPVRTFGEYTKLALAS
ncbi:MAG: LLM class flavin-dependent oxidoreductase [Methylocystaceae bacterium]|nr:MAG: LLM class flavin-dependent oxidoreductase [Methylocystaceae bacterium]